MAADIWSGIVAQVLVHFLWQGLVLWLLGWLLMRAAAAAGPQTRYAILLGLLAAIVALPIVTLYSVRMDRVEGAYLLMQMEAGPPADSALAERTAADAPAPAPSSWSLGMIEPLIVGHIHAYRHWLTFAWLTGVALFGLRMSGGGVAVWQLARNGQRVPDEVALRFEQLAARMRFRTLPALRTVERLSQAVAVGVLRPMVLMPAAWLTELPPEVLESVLAHELAHLRRWDLQLNFVQRVVETLLFFHPAVWWCSRRLRIEREMCCDLLAADALNDRVTYAKALEFVAGRQLPVLEPLLAAGIGATNMVLLDRVRNVLGINAAGSRHKLRWLLAAAAVLLLIGYVLFSGGAGTHMPVATQLPKGYVPPSERDRTLLPEYIIGPPDVLVIEVPRLVPKSPYHIRPSDVLAINLSLQPLTDVNRGNYVVDTQGRVNFGLAYDIQSPIPVAGMTTDEAAVAIKKVLAENYESPRVSVSMVQSSALQPVSGEHLVSSDGTVSLGVYGSVGVAGLTLREARHRIDSALSRKLDDPQAAVSVFAYNSMVYYVITRENDNGDHVTRLAITGNDTVMDALAHVNTTNRFSDKQIWISRPVPNPALGSKQENVVLPVDWNQMTAGGSTASNYQILPGDRLFITEKPSRWNLLRW